MLYIERSFMILKVQQLYRGVLGRRAALHARRASTHRSVSIVQAGFRGMRGRRRARRYRAGRDGTAVVCIQRWARGCLDRARAAAHRAGMEAGARLIQKYFRRHQHAMVSTAAALIQRQYRHNMVGRAARRIQTNFRGFVGRFWCAREKAKLRAREQVLRCVWIGIALQGDVLRCDFLR